MYRTKSQSYCQLESLLWDKEEGIRFLFSHYRYASATLRSFILLGLEWDWGIRKFPSDSDPSCDRHWSAEASQNMGVFIRCWYDAQPDGPKSIRHVQCLSLLLVTQRALKASVKSHEIISEKHQLEDLK